MKQLPQSDQSLLVRTDFQDAAAWESLCEAVRSLPPEVGGFAGILAMANAHLGDAFGAGDEGEAAACTIVDDVAYANAAIDDLWKAAAQSGEWPILFVFDAEAAAHPDLAVLVIDLRDDPGQSFRATPDQVYWIESNLSISNMDWEDFADALDEDGVHRGFGES